MPYEKYKRFWAVTDAAGRLICLAVYRKGAQEVLRRLDLTGGDTAGALRRNDGHGREEQQDDLSDGDDGRDGDDGVRRRPRQR